MDGLFACYAYKNGITTCYKHMGDDRPKIKINTLKNDNLTTRLSCYVNKEGDAFCSNYDTFIGLSKRDDPSYTLIFGDYFMHHEK